MDEKRDEYTTADGASSNDGKNETKSHNQFEEEDGHEYPPKKVVLPAMAAVYLAVFLVALDRTIIGTAVPSISDQFQSFGDVSWYEVGFLLPLCMLQLSFGRVYRYYPAKWILFTLVAIFEIGSIVSAAAPTSKALIVGRAVTGIGGAGITSGALILINNLVPLKSRPKYTGSLGAVFGLSSIIAPLISGYLTAVTWRWCFWINVPIGGVSLVALLFFAPKSPGAIAPAKTWLGKVKQLDPLGFILIAPSTVCLLFAVQWGGTKYAWSSGTIIALFVVFAVLLIAFIASQIWRGEDGTVPPRILRQRTVLAATVASLGVGSLLVVLVFFLPIWFQVVQGKSPQASGLSLLPLLISNVLTVITGGILTSKLGYYTPFMIVGGAIAIVGTALLTTWEVDVSTGKWIGYQIVSGVGLGLTLQQPGIAVQTVLSKEDAPIGITLITFVQFLGASIFVTVSQTVLENGLVSGLQGKVQGVDASLIANGGATSLTDMVPANQLEFVLDVYNNSVRDIWYIALGLACLVFLASLGMEWKSVKAKDGPKAEDEA